MIVPANKTRYIGIAALVLLIVTSFAYRSLSYDPQQNLISKADEIVSALSKADYATVAKHVDASAGVQFMPYIYDLGEVRSVQFSQTELETLIEQNRDFIWGVYDGIGSPIELDPTEYHQSFVYDFPYATETVAQLLDQDADLFKSQLRTVRSRFADASFVLYRYDGSPSAAYNDWRALLLVFEEREEGWSLIAIGHGEKTL